VHERLRADGLEGKALTAATSVLSEQVVGLAEPALLYFHRKAFQRSLQDDLFLHVTEAATPAGGVEGEMTATILFADLAGFTPLAEAMGDTVAAAVIDRFSHLVRETLMRHSGKLVKQIGDAFMLVFSDPADAIAYGIDLATIVAAEEAFPSLRIGAHYGTLLYREGDYIGTTVNLAARVSGVAGRCEFLVTDALRKAAGSHDQAMLSAIGPRALKGISDEVVLHAVRIAHSTEDRVTDPVCHMSLAPGSAAVTATWRGVSVFFCSASCAEQFFSQPQKYAP
jgi:adenylate cyclase